MVERYRDGVAARPGARAGARRGAGQGRAGRRRADRALDFQAGIAAIFDFVAAGQRLRHRAGAVGARQGPRPRGRPRPGALRHGREPAGARRAAQPGDAEGMREAVDVARRARPRSARSRRSASRTPGGGASCRPAARSARARCCSLGCPTRSPSARERRRSAPAARPLPLPVADSHCHLDLMGVPIAGDAAGGHGRGRGADHEDRHRRPERRWAASTAAREPGVLAAVALHPNDSGRRGARRRLRGDRAARGAAAVRAVGETGLDLFRTGPDGHAAQEESFRRAHRDREGHRQGARDPRSRRPRRRAAGAGRGGGARRHRLPLLLR